MQTSAMISEITVKTCKIFLWFLQTWITGTDAVNNIEETLYLQFELFVRVQNAFYLQIRNKPYHMVGQRADQQMLSLSTTEPSNAFF